MRAALVVEWWKLRRSPVVLSATVLMVVLLPALGLGFFTVGQRGGTGAVAQKAQALHVGPGWDGYLGSVNQIVAAAMFVGVGIVVAWMFGREHADRTFSSLFALPVSRTNIATAKYLVLAGWGLALCVLVVVVTVALGFAADVDAFDATKHPAAIARLAAVSLSTMILAFPVGAVASIGRGYLPPLAAVVLTLMAAQFAVLFGTGGWFPFAVPGLLAISASEAAPAITATQLALVPVTAAAGSWITVRWWQNTEVV